MSTQPTQPVAAQGESEAANRFWLKEQDLLFNAYFDAELTQEEREAFELRLEEDPTFQREYEVFLSIMGGLRELPYTFAPDDFVEKVQSRMRRRSQNKFFAERQNFGSARVPYEVIAVVMMLVMAAAYLMMESPHDADLKNADITLDRKQ